MAATPTFISGRQLKLAVSGGLNKDVSGNLYVEGLESLSSDPGSPADGDAWYNSTDKTPRTQVAGLVGAIPVILQSMSGANQVVVSATTTPTLLTPSALTLPANFFADGSNRQLRIRAGLGVTLNSPSGQFTFAVQLGSASVGVTMPAATAVVGLAYQVEVILTPFSVGASGTVGCWINMAGVTTGGGTQPYAYHHNAGMSVDTTGTLSLGVYGSFDTNNANHSANLYYYDVQTFA